MKIHLSQVLNAMVMEIVFKLIYFPFLKNITLTLSFALYIECQSKSFSIYDKERLVKSKQLVQLFDCMQKSTIDSMAVIGISCTTEKIHGIYDKILKRLNGEMWCVDAIGLDLTVSNNHFALEPMNIECKLIFFLHILSFN